MASWDEAQTTFLTAAAKVYAALAIAHPSGSYGSGTSVTLNIDGSSYSCRCDCTGVIQCIIQVMGYNPNWGVSSVSGHTGDGWYLTDATTSFVLDQSGNLSPDWVVLPFDASDVKPGDIRASSTHSHCDIFVAYVNNNAYGLNAGATNAIQASSNAGTKYLEDNDESDLAATWTIQDNDAAKVLRYVKGSGDSPYSSGTTSSIGKNQSLKSLDIELGFIEPLKFKYFIRDSASVMQQIIPGYFPNTAYYPTSTPSYANDSYGDTWIEFVANYATRYANSDTEWKHAVETGLIMLYTLDNSDPMQFGRTVFLKEDGTNDYEKSRNKAPIIRTQFPVHFRCVITDLETHTKDYGRSSAFLTNQAVPDSNASISNLVKAATNSILRVDATGKVYDVEDKHGYLFLHDEDNSYDREEYNAWLQGME